MKRIIKKRFWLLLGLSALILAACSGPESGESGTQEPAAVEGSALDSGDDDAEPAESDSGSGSEDSAETAAESTEEPDEANSEDTEGDETSAGAEPASSEANASEEAVASEDAVSAADDRYDFLRQVTADWTTNWSLHSVPYTEIVPAQIRDRIRSIDDPSFVSIENAAVWLDGREPVMAIDLDGEARAYPLQILTRHEIVNDVLAGRPIVVTFCPLCNSALIFDAEVDGMVLEFGTSGLLRNSDLIMYDRTTETLWQQFTGEAIVGDLLGTQLTFLPSSLVSFNDFRSAFPEGQVLSRDTGIPFDYGSNPYESYDAAGRQPYLYGQIVEGAEGIEFDQLISDDRLDAMERVISIAFDDAALAYPLSILSEAGVINDTQGDRDLAIFHTPGTSSALDTTIIAIGKDVGATGVFDPNLDGQKLTFQVEAGAIVDNETNSTWNVLGQATEGPLAGERLAPIVHGDHFWFSWAAFFPDTFLYPG